MSDRSSHERQRRSAQVLLSSDRRRGGRTGTRHAAGRGLYRCRLHQAAGRHRLDLGHGHALQHAHRQAGARSRKRRECRRCQGRDLQHHHHFRRHRQRHRRHEVFAGVPRGDRRLHRSGHRLRRFRRPGDHRRLRQEHAGVPDRHGAAEPTVDLCLWRHHPAGGWPHRHHFRVRGRGPTRAGRHQRDSGQADRGSGDSRPRFLWRHVHRQHHGLGH
ncbi:hypothetical protein D3C71_721600 [compost metagenome]